MEDQSMHHERAKGAEEPCESFYEISDDFMEPDEGDWANEPVPDMPLASGAAGGSDMPAGAADLALFIAGASEQGGRLRNEDSFMIRGDSSVASDGIGGAPYGDLLSQLCCNAFLDDWEAAREARADQPAGCPADGDALMRSVFRSVDTFASRVSRYLGKGSGATLVAAARWGDSLLMGSVGDTAAFSLDGDGRLLRVMADDGRAEGAGNALREAMGYRFIERDEGRVQTALLPLAAGRRVLLCSDGVWTQLTEGRIAQVMSESDDPYVTAFRLVNEAAEALGPRSDNATAVVIHVGVSPRAGMTPRLPE